ncbi:MAG TPA: hypothetical protein P5024_08070 [Burkholderiaceae bacterium]|nr:hypothetical protein [Burkholderiaceae bacterium]HPE01080.1 hypothetical protein [Burkholderiaceae bacterium]HRZ01499.1 hypothetical protein [Burkholderiaceae bacterium]
MFGVIRDQFRTLLRIRKRRGLPSPGPKPPLGAKITRQDLRMTVQAGMSDELWRWLTDRGWRQATVRNDRRRYRDVPASAVTRLIDAAPEFRSDALREATEAATFRPEAGAAARRERESGA